MRKSHLTYLVCPDCMFELGLSEVSEGGDDVIKTGKLNCPKCLEIYPIIEYIPRFVPHENYADNFGLEWTKHAKTQYDSYSGVKVSETRFFEETKWLRNLAGETILEVGSGSGRFTEHAISTGAMVISTDLSYAVEANYAANGSYKNVLIVQSDLYKMPFRTSDFDKVICIGVLQHTPDVKKSFMTLTNYLKPDGQLVIDVYRKWTGLRGLLHMRKYWLRSLVKNIPPEKLYTMCLQYITLMWPLVKVLAQIPYLGKRIIWFLLLIPYYNKLGLSDNLLKEWAILDLFDILSAKYDSPQTIEIVRQWFSEANLQQVEIHYGYNGIEGRGVKA